MLFKPAFSTAFSGLKTQPSRSLLTVLGIVIGISAIIMVMALGRGARDLILKQIRGLGAQTIDIEPGSEPKGPSDFAQFFTDSLTARDVAALQNSGNVQGLTHVAPGVARAMSVSYESESARVTVMGGAEFTAQVLDMTLAAGAFFTEEDIRQRASLAVIGDKVKNDLFGASDALGERIKIKGKSFRVVGVAAPKGQAAIFNVDETAIVPYTTAQEYLLGINYFNFIFARAESEDLVPRAVKQIAATLREQHGIADSAKDDFHIHTQADAIERVKTVTGVLTALISAVAGISLVVGGIGIMNIMLVSVTERTREIGLRKALGATNKDILQQFLFEAVMLTASGGLIGVALGAALSLAASLVLTRVVSIAWNFIFPLAAAGLGLAVSAAIGLVFGLYPARQAAKKSPIEALRYE